MASKAKKTDTLKPEPVVYAVKLDDDTIINVEAASAAEAEQKARALKKVKDQ